MKLYQALANAFYREQVTTCFALLGDANMHWAGAVAETGVECIYTRHEHAAVAAATAFSRGSGKVGVATVTCGPGVDPDHDNSAYCQQSAYSIDCICR